MIQVLLIVLPCTLVGTAVVLLVQRAGWLLPRLESPPAAPPAAAGGTTGSSWAPAARGTTGSSWAPATRSSTAWRPAPPVRRDRRQAPRPLLVAVVVILGAWILVWIVILAIGLNIIGGAS